MTDRIGDQLSLKQITWLPRDDRRIFTDQTPQQVLNRIRADHDNLAVLSIQAMDNDPCSIWRSKTNGRLVGEYLSNWYKIRYG